MAFPIIIKYQVENLKGIHKTIIFTY